MNTYDNTTLIFLKPLFVFIPLLLSSLFGRISLFPRVLLSRKQASRALVKAILEAPRCISILLFDGSKLVSTETPLLHCSYSLMSAFKVFSDAEGPAERLFFCFAVLSSP